MTTATETFLTYAQAKNDGDLDTAMSMWHPDAVLRVPAADLVLQGRDQARAFFALFIDALDGYHGEVVSLGVDTETVIADWILHGTLTGPLFGIEPTGAELDLPVLSIADIRDGVFMAETVRFDLAGLARQADLPVQQLIDLLDLQHKTRLNRQARPASQTDESGDSQVPDAIDPPSSHRQDGDADAFLDAFVEGWREPQSLEQFLDHFLPFVDPEVRLQQPLGTEHGHDGFERVFKRLFTLMPDVHGEVQDAVMRPDGLLITLRMQGSLRGSRTRGTSSTGSPFETGGWSNGTPTSTRCRCSLRSFAAQPLGPVPSVAFSRHD